MLRDQLSLSKFVLIASVILAFRTIGIAQFNGFVRPLEWAQYNATVSSAYSTVYRGNYSGGAEGSGSHPGVDITEDKFGNRLTTRTEVRAIYQGVIKRRTIDGKKDAGWGNSLVIKHTAIPDTGATGVVFSAYAHLSDLAINPGTGQQWNENDPVPRGALLGFVGATGNATGVHLHFQIDRDYSDYPVHPFWPNRTDGTTDAQLEVSVPDSDGLISGHTFNPIAFVDSHLAPKLTISTPNCPTGASCTGPQGTTFNFEGGGFTPGSTVQRFIVNSMGTQAELTPILSADGSGKLSWVFTSSCLNSSPGTFSIFAVDTATGKESNRVTEIITPGNCVQAPTCTLSANPTTINLSQSSTLTWTTANNPTSASIDNGVGSVNPAGGSTNVSPTAAMITYTLTVTNAAGSGNCAAQVTVTRPISSINDDFNDNSLNTSLWSTFVPPSGSSVTETNQRLEIRLGPGLVSAGIISACALAGDFDVQVDYALITWPPSNPYGIGLRAFDLGPGIGLQRNSSSGGFGEFYTIIFRGGAAQIATTDTVGTLRLVRTGSTLSGFFFNGTTWTLVGSGSTITNNTRFSIDVGSNSASAQGGIFVTYDNFRVNNGAILCPRQDFDFALDALLVDGNIAGSGNPNGVADFIDNFDDGSLTTPPTSSFFFNPPTVLNESGGFLNLRSGDGTAVSTVQTPSGNTAIFMQDYVYLGFNPQVLLNDGGGNSVVEAVFRADAPVLFQFYGLFLITQGSNEAVTIQVGNTGFGSFVTGFVLPSGAGQTIPVNLQGVQRIHLRLTLDDATNRVTPSFSVDGGNTFTQIVLPSPGSLFSTSGQAVVSTFGSTRVTFSQ